MNHFVVCLAAYQQKLHYRTIILLLTSAANIFLTKISSEYHELKTRMLQKEVPEELAFALLKWFMENDGSMTPSSSPTMKEASSTLSLWAKQNLNGRFL